MGNDDRNFKGNIDLFFHISVLFMLVTAKGKCDTTKVSREGNGEGKVSGKTKIKCEWIAKAAIMTTYESKKLFGLSDSKSFVPQLNCN